MKSTFVFTRGERLGFIGLLLLLLFTGAMSFFFRLFVHPALHIDETRLQHTWEEFQDDSLLHFSSMPGSQARLFLFDPNSIDSQGCLTLGLSERTAHYLMNWRRKGKVFYKKEDLKPLYSLKPEEYARLEPFIEIASEKYESKPEFAREEPLTRPIDLNLIDSVDLVRVRGIGAVLAHRIIERRRDLGFYMAHTQLMEVYKFPDSVYVNLCTLLPLREGNFKKFKLNTVTEEVLARHPYIGPVMAKNIILLREGLSKYENLSQLRQVPLMNEEKYRKIAPYFTID